MELHKAAWQRRGQPILSGMTTKQAWCSVELYNPTVLRVAGAYRMWYLGNRTRTRTDDIELGCADSEDGLHWREHPGNPILRGGDLPFGNAWQTPHVLFDAEEERFKMWFVAGTRKLGQDGRLSEVEQSLGYATSTDGIEWDVCPEPLLESVRRPCVLKDAPGAYRMWMGAAPEPGGTFDDVVGSIYRFTSPDGLHWTRDAEPVVTANEELRSVVYPFVLQLDAGYIMWYGCHVAGGFFEIYCSTSTDGQHWTHHHDQPALPATRNANNFDGRYTSTPCVLDDGDRYLLYYSTRDCGNLYGAGDGTVQTDACGLYRHIGVAVCPKP